MALFALAQLTTATAAASASWEVRSTAASKPKIMELGLSQNAATQSQFGIGRPGAIGVTPTSPQTFVDEGDGNAATALTTAAVAWGTGPTVPANFNRRFTTAGSFGVGVIFTFPRGLGLPVSGSIVVWILTTAPVCNVYAVVDE
jgi:hypothetical protein